MKPLAFVDVESRSYVDLATKGVGPYLADPSTCAVSVVALLDDQCRVWVNSSVFPGKGRLPAGKLDVPTVYGDPGEISVDFSSDVPAWFRELATTHTFVGHNADGFDDPFCRQVLGISAEWIDTLPLARMAGLPGRLDEIGKALIGTGKHAGSKILSQFYDARKPAPFHLLLSLVAYNIADCLLTRRLYREVESFRADFEANLYALHTTINRRGVGVDVVLNQRLIELSEQAKARAGEEIERLTRKGLRRTELRSVPKMKAWLATQGFKVENMRRDTINRLLANPDGFFEGDDETGLTLESVMPVVPRVLRLRNAAVRVTSGKLERVESRRETTDSRLRDLLVWYGANTGRFSSRVVQLHNMHRGVPKCDVKGLLARGLPTYEDLEAEAERLHLEHGMSWVAVDDVIATLIRYVLIPSEGRWFGIVDYSAIEARGAAWIAGEEKLLDAYRADRDVYCEFGSVLFGRPITKADERERFTAKTVVLGSQYGLGAEKLALYAANAGIDLRAVGVTAEQCIESYRTTYARIPDVWHALAAAVWEAVDEPGTLTEAGRVRFQMWGDHLICQLPSGRELVYPHARIEPVLQRWGETRNSVTYAHPRGYRKQIWHGLITENVVQALCRDLLCGAMLRIDRPGLEVVLHVHDEIVCEMDDPASLDVMCCEMTAGEEWSKGFPIAVEGHASRRYGKIAIA